MVIHKLKQFNGKLISISSYIRLIKIGLILLFEEAIIKVLFQVFLNCKMSFLNWIRGKTRQNYTVNAKMTSWKIVKSSEVNQSCAFPEPLQLIIELFFSLVLNSNLNIVVTYLLWATRNLYKNISFSIKLLLTEGSKSKSCTIKTAKPNEATLISRQ